MESTELKEVYEKKIREGKIVLPEGTEKIMVLQSDANIRFLPLYYLLPIEMVKKAPECVGIPRALYFVFENKHWIDIINSDLFHQLIIEGISFLSWPAFEVADYKEAFSTYDPIYLMSYMVPQLTESIYEIPLFNLQNMFKMEPWDEYPRFSFELAQTLVYGSAKIAIEKYNLRPIIEEVKKNRCDEDFANRQSHAKIDFLRKRYHKRNFSEIQEVSLDEMRENALKEFERTGIDIPDETVNVERDVTEKVLVYAFTSKLEERDMEILRLKNEGRTYQEITDIVGYKTHSAVKKRIDKIAERWLDYVDENNGITA